MGFRRTIRMPEQERATINAGNHTMYATYLYGQNIRIISTARLVDKKCLVMIQEWNPYAQRWWCVDYLGESTIRTAKKHVFTMKPTKFTDIDC